MEQNITNIDFSKGDGIVPVIVQDANTNEVLTLAYSNKESLERTLSYWQFLVLEQIQKEAMDER